MNRRAVRWSGVFVLGLVVLLGTSPAWSQAVNTGTVTGSVMLPDGTPSPGATVSLEGSALVKGTWPTVSDANGRFVFLRVPPGTYKATASLSGFNTAQFEDIVISGGTTVPLTFNLEIAAATGEIVVTSEAPIVDTRSSSISTVFPAELLEVVPTSRETFYDLTLTAAGMAAVGHEGDKGWLNSASAYGSAGNENIFLVNGLNTTNPRGSAYGSMLAVNYNTVQEVKVLSLGSKAEYGSFSGAAVDVLTKSGGNEFHGDLAYYSMVGDADDNTGSGLGADWLYVGEPDQDEIWGGKLEDWEANATLGGPIKRDTLWFYAGYAHVKGETNMPIGLTDETFESDMFDLKLTADFGASHRAWIGYQYQDGINTGTTWGDTFDPSMAYGTDTLTQALTAQYQWVVSDRNILSAKVLGYDSDGTATPGGVGHAGYLNWWKWIGAQPIGVGGDFPVVEGFKNKRSTLQADFSHYADDWAGTHDLKFGVQYTRGEGDFQGGFFNNVYNLAYPYPYNYGPATDWWWNIWGGYGGSPENPTAPWYNNKIEMNGYLTVRESDSTGAFVDDTWVISDRVTLNLGLRYDHMTARYGEGLEYEPYVNQDVANPTVLRTREGSGDLFDFTTWAPRLGIAWTITGDGKTVLRSHIGRYFTPLGVESLNTTGPDMPQQQFLHELYWLQMSEVDLNGNGYVDFDEVRPATRLLAGRTPDQVVDWGTDDPSWELEVAPGTTSPYTDQFYLSVQRQIGRDFALELSYVYKVTKDILGLRPYNEATGEYWEWEELPYTTWTGQETTVFQVPLRDYDGSGTIDFDDVKFIQDNTHYRALNAKEIAGKDVERTYQGVQLVFNKRYSNRWQMLASFNWNDSDGFAPRQVDQYWYIDIPLVHNTPNGSSPNHYTNNLSGPLLMTPEVLFKLAGSYKIPVIETDLGLRVRYDSGQALFPIEALPSYAGWESSFREGAIVTPGFHDYMVADDANNADWLPSKTLFDINLSKDFPLGDVGSLWVSFDVFNALNDGSANKVGYGQGDYGRVYALVAPRHYRLGVKFSF